MAEGIGSSLRKGTRFTKDWTKGSILGNLWSLSWPMLISNTIGIMGPAIDMIWVGRLGTASIAGVGVSGIAIMVANSLLMGLFTGTVAIIARFVGSGDEKSANRVAQQAFVIGIAFSIFMAIIGIFLTEQILALLGVEADVVAEGAAYMRIQLIGMVTMSSVSVAQSIMQASGDTFTPMKINIGYRLFQIVLCPFLVFGWWVFPSLGVSGASLSNVIAQSLGGAVGLWILFSGRTRMSVTLRNFRFDRSIIWRTVKIGIPASITNVARNFADLVLIWLITPFGTFAVAAHSLAQRIDQFAQMPSGGFGTAAGVLAGQNLGARQPEKAAKTGWMAVSLSTIFSIICSVVTWFWAEQLVRIFNADPSLVEIGSTFLRIQIVSYMLWGVVVVLSLCLNGIGDTMIPMITNLITMCGLQIILAYFLSRIPGLGVYGIRWGIASGIVARAVIYSVYFKVGRWKNKKV
jgi:putative MATE family efflux protein